METLSKNENKYLIQIEKLQDVPCLELKEFLEDYVKNRANDLDILEESIRNNDIAQIKTIAHKVLGTAKSYGYNRLERLMQILDKQANKKDKHEIEQVISAIKEYLKHMKTIH